MNPVNNIICFIALLCGSAGTLIVFDYLVCKILAKIKQKTNKGGIKQK